MSIAGRTAGQPMRRKPKKEEDPTAKRTRRRQASPGRAFAGRAQSELARNQAEIAAIVRDLHTTYR